MYDKFKLIAKSLGEERVRFDEDLSIHTHSILRIRAKCFYIATNTQELITILDLALELKVPFLVLGGGTKFNLNDQTVALIIKNRSSNIKLAGIKGKVGREGIGVKEALVLVDSGVSLAKLNSFLAAEKLQDISGFSSLHSTVGGAIFVDQGLQEAAEKITIWSQGIISDVISRELDITTDIVLSVVLKLKPNNSLRLIKEL